MKDEIIINLRALTERQRNNIAKVLNQSLDDIEDEVNAEALNVLNNFVEE